jgi:autotransporter-associated beta strand protein
MVRRLRIALLASSALCMAPFLAALPAAAQNATWLNAPASGNFNTAANWSPATVPTGTAFFDTSGTTALSFSLNASLSGWTFNAGASAYTFSNFEILQFNGAGIVINGGSATITNHNNLIFRNASTAGSATIISDGILNFNDASTAGSASSTNNNLFFGGTATAGNASSTNASLLQFFNTSTAGSASIANNSGGGLNFVNTSTAGGASITNTGNIAFYNTSTAGSAAITNNSGSGLVFTDTSTAGTASITNNSGSIINFTTNSTAGNATITNAGNMLFLLASTAGNATIANNSAQFTFNGTSTAGNAAITNSVSGITDFSNTTGPNNDHKLSAGSFNGGGFFKLGQNELTVGGNNLSTNVTGVIANGGFAGGFGASLIKTGTGTMMLSGVNTYTGATTVNVCWR